MLGRTGGHYPRPRRDPPHGRGHAPLCRPRTAATIEGQAFSRLAPVAGGGGAACAVFRLGERNRHDSGLDDAEPVDAPDTLRLACRCRGGIGRGDRGGPAAGGACRLTLVDVQPEAARPGGSARSSMKRPGSRATKRSRSGAGRWRRHRGSRTATSLAAIASADLVIESVLERTDVKRQVLAEIERTVGPDTVIATNTSTNPIAKLATVLDRAGRGSAACISSTRSAA